VRVPVRRGSAITVAALGLALSVTGAATLPFAAPAFASTPAFGGASQAVFVQTDNPSGNQVVAYHRAPGGALSPAGRYAPAGSAGSWPDPSLTTWPPRARLATTRGTPCSTRSTRAATPSRSSR